MSHPDTFRRAELRRRILAALPLRSRVVTPEVGRPWTLSYLYAARDIVDDADFKTAANEVYEENARVLTCDAHVAAGEAFAKWMDSGPGPEERPAAARPFMMCAVCLELDSAKLRAVMPLTDLALERLATLVGPARVLESDLTCYGWPRDLCEMVIPATVDD